MKNIFLTVFLFTAVFCLMPRNPAPGFKAIAVNPDLTFSTVNLSDFEGEYVVLLFYPFDFTYVCPTEIVSFSESMDKFKCKASLIM